MPSSRRTRRAALLLSVVALLAGCSPTDGPQAAERAGSSLEILASLPVGATPLPMTIGGRVVETSDAEGRTLYMRQWPGTYFETAFQGPSVVLGIGPGEMHLAVSVDGGEPLRLLRPEAGDILLDGLGRGEHAVRVDVINESQAGPSGFGGFFAPPGVEPGPLPQRDLRLEFIGDSWTVGYANASTQHDCDGDTVWITTDTSRGIAGIVSRALEADYRVNAISGRGVVRNYNGGTGDTLPQAYPYALFGGDRPAADTQWRPDAVILSLGTNDFSTPLGEGEPWETREALREDVVATYAAFLEDLRQRYPEARLVLWADETNTEVAGAAREAVARREAAGEARIDFIPVQGLGLTACHGHPDLADDRLIAEALVGFLNSHGIRANRKTLRTAPPATSNMGLK